MKNHLITAILAATTVAALSTAAVADRRPNQTTVTKIGEVGTHEADGEDYVTVSPARRYDTITIRARGGVVPLDSVRIEYVDGRTAFPFTSREVLRPGQSLTFDVPGNQRIKMLKLDYNERDRRWGERGTARVEVFGQKVARHDRNDRRYNHDSYRDDRYDDRPRTIVTPAPRPAPQPRYEWRGGVYIRVN